MKKQQNNTKKIVAKKRATKRVKDAKPDSNFVSGMAPIDEDSPEFMAGVRRGVDVASEEFEQRDSTDPWWNYNSHRQNVIDINARLDDLEQEKRRLTTRLSHESAKMEGYRKMVIQLAITEPAGT